MTEPEGQQPPLLRVVRGEPTPEELAALVAVVAARASAGGAAPEHERPSPWASKAVSLRQPLHPGPGAWAASAHTR